MNICAVLVDDEPLARRRIRRYLRNHAEIEIVAECGEGESAVRAILERKPDLLLLDIQMPEMDGFEVVRSVGTERMPPTIFVTAYDRYAVRAFDENAVDYLLKPFGQERFDKAVARAKERIAGGSDRAETRQILETLEQIAQNRYAGRLPIAVDGRIVFVKTRDIDWIEAEGNYARLHFRDRTYELRETLTNLEKKLDPRNFVRIHRSTIINIHRVREIQPWFRGYHLVLLENGKELRMSRYQHEVATRLGLKHELIQVLDSGSIKKFFLK